MEVVAVEWTCTRHTTPSVVTLEEWMFELNIQMGNEYFFRWSRWRRSSRDGSGEFSSIFEEKLWKSSVFVINIFFFFLRKKKGFPDSAGRNLVFCEELKSKKKMHHKSNGIAEPWVIYLQWVYLSCCLLERLVSADYLKVLATECRSRYTTLRFSKGYNTHFVLDLPGSLMLLAKWPLLDIASWNPTGVKFKNFKFVQESNVPVLSSTSIAFFGLKVAAEYKSHQPKNA